MIRMPGFVLEILLIGKGINIILRKKNNVTAQLGETPALELAVYLAQRVDLATATVRQWPELRLRLSIYFFQISDKKLKRERKYQILD